MNEIEVKIGDTKIILEPMNEKDELNPHLFIFKNDVAIMLDSNEIISLYDLINNNFKI